MSVVLPPSESAHPVAVRSVALITMETSTLDGRTRPKGISSAAGVFFDGRQPTEGTCEDRTEVRQKAPNRRQPTCQKPSIYFGNEFARPLQLATLLPCLLCPMPTLAMGAAIPTKRLAIGGSRGRTLRSAEVAGVKLNGCRIISSWSADWTSVHGIDDNCQKPICQRRLLEPSGGEDRHTGIGFEWSPTK